MFLLEPRIYQNQLLYLYEVRVRKLGVIKMGLLSIIRKIKRKEKEMRILMVGLDNSGKTTIVLKINGEDTSVISPTLGFNIKTIMYQKYGFSASFLFCFSDLLSVILLQ
ncbi:hypothetical protein H5410_035697 [Solanum commersonii]|uniref:ADP-ribosylation factor n=1 Tax=Solanum commersonii TaxID=4109 RepID=A0A9J5Y210_SOLCO|nr:hypothetical protein H5410_035697 [Solanum commersonii]